MPPPFCLKKKPFFAEKVLRRIPLPQTSAPNMVLRRGTRAAWAKKLKETERQCDTGGATLNSSKIPSKYLMFTFRERAFTFGERAFTFGERAFTFGDNRGFRVFWIFLFCCWGVFGLRGSGGPVGVFENI